MKSELNYPIIYSIEKQYEEHKCDPRQYTIAFCKDFIELDCPRTCKYASELERKAREGFK